MSAVNNSSSSNNTNSVSSEAEAIIEKDLAFVAQEIENFSKMLASLRYPPGSMLWILNLGRDYSTLENVARQLHPETLRNAQAILKIVWIAKESFSAILGAEDVGTPLDMVVGVLGAKMSASDAFKAELIALCPAYKYELKLFEDQDLQFHTIVYCLSAPEEKIHESLRGMRNDPAISALYQELLQLPCFGNFDTPLLKIISEYGVDPKALITKYFGSKKEGLILSLIRGAKN